MKMDVQKRGERMDKITEETRIAKRTGEEIKSAEIIEAEV